MKTRECILLFFTLFMISCSPYKQFVRTSSDFISVRNNIDTITVISDALVAINAKNDYYSANASYVLDSLILQGVKQSLIKKGYVIKTLKPSLMGSFMDTVQIAPLKPLNNVSIQAVALPYIFPNHISDNQINAIRSINRKLYMNMVYNDPLRSNKIKITNNTRSNLDTISNLINGNYALFVFHQAALVSSVKTGTMALGTLALTTVLTGGAIIGFMTEISAFHTYLTLLELSTGNIIWSNYIPFNAGPIDPLVKMAKKNSMEITNYINPDTLFSQIEYRWSKKNLSSFPNRISSSFFKGYKNRKMYPAQDFFHRSPIGKTMDLDDKKMRKIDSLVNDLSIYEDYVRWEDTCIVKLTNGKGRKSIDINYTLNEIDDYLKYAYYCRLKYRTDLNGKIKVSFIISADGNNNRVQILESTVNDDIMEYAVPYIIKMFKFRPVSSEIGDTKIIREISFRI